MSNVSKEGENSGSSQQDLPGTEEEVFSPPSSRRIRIISTWLLFLTKKEDGILQKILPQDQEILSRTRKILERWREKGFHAKRSSSTLSMVGADY